MYTAGMAPPTYRGMWQGYPRLHRAVLLALQDVPAGSRVLDAGSGFGLLTEQLAEHWRVVGIEIAADRVQQARARLPQVAFLEADLSKPIALGEPYDAIVSVEVIEHVFAPRAFAANLFEALKPGGRLVITTPYNGYLKNVAVAVTGHFDRHVNPLFEGGHIKFWSRATLTTLLMRAGFVDVRFYGLGRLPYLWQTMILTARKPS